MMGRILRPPYLLERVICSQPLIKSNYFRRTQSQTFIVVEQVQVLSCDSHEHGCHLYYYLGYVSLPYLTSSVVLYCIEGVVIAAQCTATFLRSIVLPELRYY